MSKELRAMRAAAGLMVVLMVFGSLGATCGAAMVWFIAWLAGVTANHFALTAFASIGFAAGIGVLAIAVDKMEE
jgi:hypothetical protein